MTEVAIDAPASTVFAGYPVGTGGKAACTDCHCTVRDGGCKCDGGWS